MTAVTATEAKNALGLYLSQAQREPIHITKSGRSCAVLISEERFALLEQIEDHLLSQQAEKARQEGFLGTTESANLLSQLMSA